MTGSLLTWTNSRGWPDPRDHIEALFDRAFFSEDWPSHGDCMSCYTLLRMESDHNPIVVHVCEEA